MAPCMDSGCFRPGRPNRLVCRMHAACWFAGSNLAWSGSSPLFTNPHLHLRGEGSSLGDLPPALTSQRTAFFRVLTSAADLVMQACGRARCPIRLRGTPHHCYSEEPTCRLRVYTSSALIKL